jgi:hypothetical protein
MATKVNRFKRFYYGTLPYLFYRLFYPQSPKIACFQFIQKYSYSYPFFDEFVLHYEDFKATIYKDDEKGLKYVLHKGNQKLYFPRHFTDYKIAKLYKALVIEQDVRSPHHYVDSIEEFRGKTLLDIGSAEGIVTLEAIEAVEFVYLFECESEWIEALMATFEPWQDKVKIIKKYISDHNDKTCQTLDDFLKDKPRNNLFLKMDIEGAECKALKGSSNLFSEADDLQFAICVYHNKNDLKAISSFLDRYHCTYFLRKGFIKRRHRIRPCLIRGSKESQILKENDKFTYA